MAGFTLGKAQNVSDAVRARNGARWFYWIGGLSVLNSIVAFLGTDFMMVFGLSSTLVGTYVGIRIGGIASILGMAVTVCVGLAFVGLGWMSERGASWAFLTGMVLYGADAVLSLVLQDYLGSAAHVFALLFVGSGFAALLRIKKATAGAQQPAGPQVPDLPTGTPPAALHDAPGFAEATAPAPLD